MERNWIVPMEIHRLPTESLREILLCLPTGQRIQLRRVCKKWRDVIDDCWRAVKTVMILGTSNVMDQPGITGIGDTIKIVSPLLSLQELMDSRQYSRPERRDLRSNRVLNQQRSHKYIISHCLSMKKLTSHFVDEELLCLIGGKARLRELTLEYNVRNSSINRYTLFSPILNLRNLRELRIVTQTARYKGRLAARIVPITDGFLVKLATDLLQLELLWLSVSRELTDLGIEALSNLPKLRELRVYGCSKIGGQSLYLFPHLEVISFNACGVTDAAGIKLLKRTQTMRVLNLGSIFITQQLIVAAMREVMKRKNGIPLTLGIPLFDMGISNLRISSSLLEVVHLSPEVI